MNHPDPTRYIFPELWSASHTDHIANLEQVLRVTQQELLEYKEARRLYYELILAVASKFDNETRHQTALRYIFERERRDHGTAEEKKP